MLHFFGKCCNNCSLFLINSRFARHLVKLIYNYLKKTSHYTTFEWTIFGKFLDNSAIATLLHHDLANAEFSVFLKFDKKKPKFTRIYLVNFGKMATLQPVQHVHHFFFYYLITSVYIYQNALQFVNS